MILDHFYKHSLTNRTNFYKI